MKILFFADTHSNKKHIMTIIKKAKKADLIVCLGDISFFEHAIDLILKDLDHIKKRIIMLHGNHEDENTLKTMCEKTKFVEYHNKDIFEIDGITFFTYGGGGFLVEDSNFDEVVEKHQRALVEADRLILLTHQPPFNTNIDQIHGKSVGNMNIKDFIRDYNPIIAASGHIHDTFGKEEMVKDCLVFNPGPKGKIVDLEKIGKNYDFD